jgi:flagellar basal body-associated protein FliL
MKGFVVLLILLFVLVSGAVFAQAASHGTEAAAAKAETADSANSSWKYIAAALAVGIS